LRTVTADEADRLTASGEWFIALREPADFETTPRPAPKAAEFAVEIAWLHHRKPHHSDTDARRTEKQRASEEARRHECTVELEYDVAISEWAPSDVRGVVSDVRRDMPVAPPDGRWIGARFFRGEEFRDGRALYALGFTFDTGRAKRYQPGAMVIGLTTVAGYSARIVLAERPPIETLATIIFADNDTPSTAEVMLNLRASAKMACGRKAVA